MNRREKIFLIIIGILSISLVTGFTTNFGSVYSDSKIKQEQELTQKVVQISKEPLTEEKIQPALLTIDTQTKSPLTVIFKEVENSVVQITSKVSTINPYIIINGMPLESQSTRLGSGFVYDAEGHIITNHHVVAGAKEVDVRFVDGNIYSAKVIGSDPFNDIAVLQIIDDFSEEHVVPLKIGDSSVLEVGQQIIAIGNPFGLSNTMTTGIVSQTGRLLPNTESGFSIPNVIQTDAAINPGNSGGPMLNLQGYVIGINTAIQSKTGEFSGIGFAVPSNTIKKIVPSLIEKGSYEHPWLGVAGTNLTPDITKQLGLPKNYKGVLITTVVDDGPAQKAGLQEATYAANGGLKGGDIITALDGRQIRDMDDLIIYIADNKNVGDSVLLQINRNGDIIELTAILQARPTN
ncbi:MAG: trypsin-like peptidase domain-containing protein [Candidatus Nitrosotenuis sp.]